MVGIYKRKWMIIFVPPPPFFLGVELGGKCGAK
uniref:Uncharacterized protein n=1 Tax=Rhizophora mucronata TaxID=61149 RepID=A0A2P2R4N6_RHIMU